ncbi:MAG TPA: DUF3418 domain-containing protein [Bryobacteraceae bacterium]|nr:DUF3418 domain-containing protein [Bryobacteraceae bacterium]
MATAAQISANQQNAQFSTGPRTEAGKQTVSRNSFVHGLAAKHFFLHEEDKLLFEQLRESLVDHYKPATAHERALLDELAEARWRCRTARIMENSFFDTLITEQRKADSSLTVERALARMFIDETQQKRLRLMMRYLNAAERSAEKARNELERIIAIRREHERAQARFQAYLATCATRGPQPPAVPETEDRVCSVHPQKR